MYTSYYFTQTNSQDIYFPMLFLTPPQASQQNKNKMENNNNNNNNNNKKIQGMNVHGCVEIFDINNTCIGCC
jgi:hypothetical protein